MKKGLNKKRFGIQKAMFCVGFALSMLMCSTKASAQENLYTSTTNSASEESYEYYEGKVTSGVNVRQEAGADQAKVMVNGKGVALAKGTMVTIVETTKVGSKPWYKIQFTYKGQELEGYATSSYINKTGVVITPTPLPIPTSEPTVEPTAMPEPTKAIEAVVTPIPTAAVVPDTEKEAGNNTPVFLIVGLIAIAAVGGGLYVYYVKKNNMDVKQAAQISEKVAKLKNILLSSKETDNDTIPGKTLPQVEQKKPEKTLPQEDQKKSEIRVSKRERVVRQAELLSNKSKVYVLKSKEEPMEDKLEFATTKEEVYLEDEPVDVSENTPLQQETGDKKALRIAIHNLKEHDIILHKFFGKGEVYDNSDVRLIEIRFGSDVRFMNKEQLVNKRLIQITNEKRR